MPELPKPRLPKPPKISKVLSRINPIQDVGDILKDSIESVQAVINEVDGAIHQLDRSYQKAPPAPAAETIEGAIAAGTACLACSRDHFSAASSMLSEGLRFAREKGLKDPEVVRRIGLALDELNAMERIDLAPQEVAKLSGADHELAQWALKNSRELRHNITAIETVEDMERVAAIAGDIRDEFLSRLMEMSPRSYAEECETCPPLLDLKQWLEEKRRQEEG